MVKRQTLRMLTRAVYLWVVMLVVAPAVVGETQTRLDVRIVASDPPTGLAGVALWSSGEGSPEDIRHALQTVYVPITDDVAHVTLDAGVHSIEIHLEWRRRSLEGYVMIDGCPPKPGSAWHLSRLSGWESS